MEDLKSMFKTKFERSIEGGSLLGIILKTYEDQDNPIMVKMRDDNGDYTKEYRASDILSKGYDFSQIHKKLSGKNVAYITDNHIDIISADVGCWINKKYTTGFYKNDNIEDIAFKVKDADVNIIIVDQAGLDKIKDLPQDIKDIFIKVFLLEGTQIPEDSLGFKELGPFVLEADESKVKLISYDDPKEVEKNIIKVVYTSGSTGKPKGVPITNRNTLYSCFGFTRSMFGDSEERERTAFFLPNAHIFQSAVYGLAYSGSFLGYITTKETFMEDMPKIKPTFIFGVPLLYQKIAQQVEIKMTSMLGGVFKERDLISPTWKNKLFIKPFFSKLVKKKLGFSKAKTIFSAGAAMNSKTYDFYEHTFGIKVTEAYGMSESTATLTSARHGRKGAAGKVAIVNTVEIRNKDEDGVGEIWVKGGNIFNGYLNSNSRDEFDDKGFFKTGDRGLFDKDGFIYIRGRIKNYHKGADGRFYNIESIAEKVLDKGHHIQQVAIYLLDAAYPTALITLGEEFLDFNSYKNDKKFLSELKEECHEIIKSLESEKYFPIPRKFLFAPSYTEENGLLTPTKKTKVMKVLALYEEEIRALSEQEGAFAVCAEGHGIMVP